MCVCVVGWGESGTKVSPILLAPPASNTTYLFYPGASGGPVEGLTLHCEDHVLAGHPRSIASCAGVAARVDRKGLLNLQSTCGGSQAWWGKGRGLEQELLVMEGTRLLPTPARSNCLCCPMGAEGMRTRF